MGPRFIGDCPLLTIRLTFLSLFIIFLILASSFENTVASSCRVELCSIQFRRAVQTQTDLPIEDLSYSHYHYCTVLHSYADCIRATARSCRGDLSYHSIYTLVMQWLDKKNCTLITAKEMPEHSQKQPFKPKQMVPSKCMFRGSHSGPVEFSHCGLFGDPHLRTFYNEFQTCRTLGAWPLIDNPYIAVQVTNKQVSERSKATGTTKVTVLLRDHKPCTTEKTYEAETNSLPKAFVDGTNGMVNDATVFIEEKEPGKHIEIHARHMSTHIIIRQIGKYLTFAIKIPEEIAKLGEGSEALQMCLKGCPQREIINYGQFVHVAMPVQEAVNLCTKWNATDFYFDACVFDLITTGDKSFSKAASDARRDFYYLNPSFARGNNRTYLLPETIVYSDHGTPENSAPGRPLVQFSIAICLCLTFCKVPV
ncbi:repulsive guidance molecule A-like isoform X2 [Tachypleus tridentatus]